MLSINTLSDFLKDNGYYYDIRLIENFLLSLKIKPFLILTGDSGTGKTKLPLLISRYLNDEKNAFYSIKVSTLKRSWKPGKKDNQIGWTIFKECLDDILPIDMINGEYEVEIGGYNAEVKISLMVQIYYDHNNEEFKNHFKNLYYQELSMKEEDEKFNRKHKKQMVDLGVTVESLNNLISSDYAVEEEIILKSKLTKSTTEGKGKLVPFEIFDYIPFNKKVSTVITTNGLFANANLEIKLRMTGYGTDEIKKYLKGLYDAGETSFELKIKGISYDFNEYDYSYLNFSNNQNYCLMPVASDWNDGSPIIGYYDVLNDKYHYTPANNLINKAKNDPNNPYLLILDGMNLSNVGKYFSNFLFAIENGEEIPLYGNDGTLKLPENLFIIGIVEDMESTKFLSRLSDKTNFIELNFSSASDFMSLNSNKNYGYNSKYLEYLFKDSNKLKYNINILKEILSSINCEDGNLWDILSIEISKFDKILKDSKFSFNYRIINEILRFMVVAWRYDDSPNEWYNWIRYFDAQIKQRILPLLYGSKKDFGNILYDLLNICLNTTNFSNQELLSIEIYENNSKYSTSALKLQKMICQLLEKGYVSFID